MASDESDSGDLSDADFESAPLSNLERTVCGVVGVAALVAGGVAVFLNAGDVGSGVLLVIGAVFMLMATTGSSITSAKIGDNEFRLAKRLIRQVESKLETAPAEVRTEFAEAVLESAPAEWRSIAKRARWVLYEERIREELTRLMPDAEIRDGGSAGGDGGLDILVHQGDRTIGVEVKFAARRLAIATVRDAVGRSARAEVSALLVVASSGFTTGAIAEQEALSTPLEVRLVKWEGPTDDSALVEALRSLGLTVRSGGHS